MPGSSLPSPAGIIHGKPLTAVLIKQALNLVLSQAKGTNLWKGKVRGLDTRKGGDQGIYANS